MIRTRHRGFVGEGATLEQSGENEELEAKNSIRGCERRRLMMRKTIGKMPANRAGRVSDVTGQRVNVCNRMTQLRGR